MTFNKTFVRHRGINEVTLKTAFIQTSLTRTTTARLSRRRDQLRAARISAQSQDMGFPGLTGHLSISILEFFVKEFC
jgi:hypothetical protein